MSKTSVLEYSDSPDFSVIVTAISNVRPYLPSQGPIDNFIHHNTFHDFEHVRFEETVEHVAHVLGGEPYLTHEEFRNAILRGRIAEDEMDNEVARHLSDSDDKDLPWKRTILSALLRVPVSNDSEQTIRWWLEDGDGLLFFDAAVRQDVRSSIIARSLAKSEQSALKTLWSAIDERLTSVPITPAVASETGHDEDCSLNDLAIWMTGAYLDRGTARWSMPERERGLWYCTLQVAKYDERFRDSKLIYLAGLDGLNACARLLAEREPNRGQWNAIIQEEILEMSGWAGMIATLEERGELPDTNRSYPALVDYIALRLLLRRTHATQRTENNKAPVPYQRAAFAAQLFRAAQVMGLSGQDIAVMPERRWQILCETLTENGDFVRRRILQSAYESSYRQLFFRALSGNMKSKQDARNKKPKFQAMFCLDEREESFRRHLEEAEPECLTFGAAGFFGIDMLFQPYDSVISEPFCPIVITPKHIIRESLPETERTAVPVLSRWKKLVRVGRSRLWGAPVLPLTALVDASRLFFNLHFPRKSTEMQRKMNPSKHAIAQFVISREPAAPMVHQLFEGYTVTEMADRVETILRMVGLIDNFADTIFLIGHGSTTTNNHFQSAYDCGACGGRRGQYNSRIFAFMANSDDVRAVLKGRGITIPKETLFIGGIHDTCSEDVLLYDMDDLERTHAAKIAEARAAFDEARERNARERFRRFGDTRELTQAAALIQVQARASHASEVRPEYGHGSNAISFVGRRSTTRGLFLDRRSFLTSYDAAQDPNGETLKKILSAIMPVCSGINLEYYFSRIDNMTYGCGSKVFHNLAAMIGVMDGAGSDLRTGLPWQTVEIHEPMRLLTVLEGELDFITDVLNALPTILEHFDNGWGQLAVLSPSTHEIFLRVHGRFEKQSSFESCVTTPSSSAYYEGKRDHLPPAVVIASGTKEAAHAS